MAIRPIVQFPDPRLRLTAAPVTAFDDDLRTLAADLLDSMHDSAGIGITAPHIGVLRRLVIIELSDSQGVRTYVNPKIVWTSPEMIRGPEGSVSMPDVSAEIERHAQVRVTYQNLDGIEQTEEADGLLAICHQHEIDQLDGIFWIDKLSRLKRDMVVKRYEKIRRSHRAI